MDGQCQIENPSFLANTCQGGGSSVAVFMSLLDLIIRSNYRISEPCKQYPNKEANQGMDYFDFIVVGGGVAGSVVAGRLSENRRWKVALLEAGPDEPAATTVPTYFASAVGTHLDWNITTEPEKNACLSTGGVCKWPRGKMLGGSASLSGTMYTRGHRSIYDFWARQGNFRWSYDEILPYFKKSENNKNLNLVEPYYHGFDGPMSVQVFPYAPAIVEDLLKAGQQMGLGVHDLNGANQTGIAVAQIMLEGGMRASTPRMYLRPHYSRKNLFVKVNAHVTRVIIDKQSKKAHGVEFYENGKKRTIFATKEIIMSAGAVGSPQLLLLSGIGPKEDLEKLNIDVIQDLKVGHNLHNHVGSSVSFTLNDPDYKPTLTLESINEFASTQTGPIASNGITQVTAFTHSSYSKVVPDIQFFFDGYSSTCPDSGSENSTRVSISIRPTNLVPLSRGKLKLRSNNPFDPPMIYANYFSDQRDVEVLLEGIKLVLRYSQTEALKKRGIQIDDTPLEYCKTHEFGTDEYWRCVIHAYTKPENHQAGSCKMGPNPDDGDVVDPELRVHGVPNLRVVDASIFPQVPNGNPISSIIMAAEKGADLIKETWTWWGAVKGANLFKETWTWWGNRPNVGGLHLWNMML